MIQEETKFIETVGITEKEYEGFQVKGHELDFTSILSHLVYSGHLKETTELYNQVKEVYPSELEEGEKQLKEAQKIWAEEA